MGISFIVAGGVFLVTLMVGIVLDALHGSASSEPLRRRIVPTFPPQNPAPIAQPAAVVTDNLERDKAIHNERVKLNATFFNNLAIWFAGAGAAGAVISTVLTQIPNYLAASEIGIFAVYVAFVLKLFANREIGKLR